MGVNILSRTRRRFGWGVAGLGGLWLAWFVSPGLPIFWGPSASAEEKAAGQVLFEHEWSPRDALAHGDGLGPVFNDRSCVACHFQGGVGGGGDNGHNVVAFEAHPAKDRPEVHGGLIHKYAVADRLRDDCEALHDAFPIVKGGARIVSGCQILVADFDPVRTETVNTTPLFGAGWVDLISSKAILRDYHRQSLTQIGRDFRLDFAGARPGRPRILPDGRLGKFGWKAQFATLEDFVAAACANEVGLGNPKMPQATPRLKRGKFSSQAKPDLDEAQFRSLVAFVDTLPRPAEIVPEDAALQTKTAHGKELFAKIGCASCHTPDVGGVAGVYSDFMLHRLDDHAKRGGGGTYGDRSPDLPRFPNEYPLPEEWKTPPLWGVADSAPYFHDGASATLSAAILRHEGDAQGITAAYRGLSEPDRQAILSFLGTLRTPADARPAPQPASRGLALAR